MSSLLVESDDTAQVRESIRRIARQFGRAEFMARARRGEPIDDLWRMLADAGLIGAIIPPSCGGSGLGVEMMTVMMEELAAEGIPLPGMVLLTVVIFVLARHGTPAQQGRWLPALADGSAKLSFAITEPGAGTNSHRIATAARADGDGWIISGQKYYITGVDEADAVIVVARTGEDARGRGRLTLFLVPADAPGLSYEPIPTAINNHEKQFTLFFDDVRVPADAMVGEEGGGLRAAFSGLNPERIVVAGMCNGIARFALDRAAAYARERQVWGVPIGTHQAIAHPLAESYAQLQVNRLATQRAARLYDAGEDAGEASNIVKLLAADAAVDALDRAIQVHGGNGVAIDYGLADLWFITRLQKIAPVSREMILNYLAQHGLDLGRSY